MRYRQLKRLFTDFPGGGGIMFKLAFCGLEVVGIAVMAVFALIGII
jgi:hypothetical protein